MTETSHTEPRWIEYRALRDLPPALRNPKRHDRPGIRRSLERFGFTSGCLLDERTGRLVAGHGRSEVLGEMEREGAEPPDGIKVDEYGVWQVPVQRGWHSASDDEAEAYCLTDNRLTELGGWDDAELLASLQRLGEVDETLLIASGFDRGDVDDLLSRLSDLGENRGGGPPTPTLADRFLIPPFDILDARGGWWRERKMQWLGLGIRSELGRAAGKPHPAHEEPGKGKDAYLSAGGQTGPDAVNAKRKESRPGALLLKSDSGRDSDYYRKKQAVERRLGRELSTEEFQRDYYVPGPGNGGVSDSGTSVFDPVLCELVYRWFCPPGGAVLDPFAGGSVRGLVAAALGRDYTGIDLSADQIAANEAQIEALLPARVDAVRYLHGDSRDLLTGEKLARQYDLLFTCPPYYGLERYSDDPRDLSTMSVEDFDAALGQVIAAAAPALREHAYAVIVVGDVRAKDGRLIDLTGTTVRLAAAAGLRLLSIARLVTPIGSLAVRAPKQFVATRVLGRTHQSVVILYKGDRRKAAEQVGPVDVTLPEELDTSEEPAGSDLGESLAEDV